MFLRVPSFLLFFLPYVGFPYGPNDRYLWLVVIRQFRGVFFRAGTSYFLDMNGAIVSYRCRCGHVKVGLVYSFYGVRSVRSQRLRVYGSRVQFHLLRFLRAFRSIPYDYECAMSVVTP